MVKNAIPSRQKPPFFQIWLGVLTRPKADHFRHLLSSSGSSILDACVWVVGCEIFAAVLSIYMPALVKTPIAETVIGYLVSPTLVFVALVTTTHLGSRLFGGSGNFSDLVYLTAAYFAPLFALGSLLNLLLAYFKVDLSILLLPFSLYETALAIVTVKAVHDFKTGKAFITALVIPSIVILALVFVGSLLIYR